MQRMGFLTALAALLASCLLLSFWVSPDPTAFDLSFTRFLQSWRTSTSDAAFRLFSVIGNGANPFLIVAVLAAIFFSLRWKQEACLLMAVAVAAGVLNRVLKILVARPRPTPDLARILAHSESPAYPSGHAAFALVLFGFLSLVAVKRSPHGWLPWLLVPMFVLSGAAVGLSRVYLGVHWLTDVLGGFVLGAVVLMAVLPVYRHQ